MSGILEPFEMNQNDDLPYIMELLFQGPSGKKWLFDPTGCTVKFNMSKGVVNIIDHGVGFLVSMVIDWCSFSRLPLAWLTVAPATALRTSSSEMP